MTMRLYEIQEQLAQIDAILENNTDAETQEILESAKQEVLAVAGEKMESILDFVAELKARADYLKSEETRLAQKRKALEKKTDWLKNLMFGYMKSQNLQKAEFGTWNLSVAKTPAKVILTDDAEELLPDSLCRITRIADKTAIKQAMGDDNELTVEIDGRLVVVAQMAEQGSTLKIK